MANRNVSWPLVSRGIAAAILVMFLHAGLARAQDRSANYTFVLASGFLCEASESASCSAVAKSPNGDTYKFNGAGAFNMKTMSVTAAGNFAHESSNGAVLEKGVWIVSQLVSFDSYGTEPAALKNVRRSFGTEPFGPKHLPMSPVSVPTGGLAVFRIRLLPISGGQRIAVLQANCALGNVPRERSVEGIRLTLERNTTEYSEEVGGRVMFISMLPETSELAKPPQQAAPQYADVPSR